jgi:predicted esterase YcpF (UPF0227 family)
MKILFIHGLASSGVYKTAESLRILFRPCEVVAPDVPIDPAEALPMLHRLCEEEHPDLIVGLSLGGFWAQKLRGYRKICINPDFHPSARLHARMGENTWLSPRRDGTPVFTITPAICEGYAAVEQDQFEGLTDEERAMTHGLFADNDEIVDNYDEFALHYPGSAHRYPGQHLPIFPELRDNLVPLAQKLFLQ